MSRLRLYAAGTGRLQYDSSGISEAATADWTGVAFRTGTELLVDTERRELRCFIVVERTTREQVYAELSWDADERFPDVFEQAIETLVAETEWTLYPGDATAVADHLFDAFRAPPEPPTVADEADDGPRQVAVPSIERAVTALRGWTDAIGGRVAICRQPDATHLKDCDVVFVVDPSVDTPRSHQSVEEPPDCLDAAPRVVAAHLNAATGLSRSRFAVVPSDGDSRLGPALVGGATVAFASTLFLVGAAAIGGTASGVDFGVGAVGAVGLTLTAWWAWNWSHPAPSTVPPDGTLAALAKRIDDRFDEGATRERLEAAVDGQPLEVVEGVRNPLRTRTRRALIGGGVTVGLGCLGAIAVGVPTAPLLFVVVGGVLLGTSTV